MTRDYLDMQRIFNVESLPESFKIEAIRHNSGFALMDGPPPVLYLVTITWEDYKTLSPSLSEHRIPINYNYGKFLAVYEFRPDFSDAWFENYPNTSDSHFGEMYEIETTSTKGNYLRSNVLADLRTTQPVGLLISTTVPFNL